MPLDRTSLPNVSRALPRGIALALALLLLAAGSSTAAQAVDVVFVLDNSGSMKSNDPEFLTRRAVSDFVDALAADRELDGRVGIVLFDGRVRLGLPLMPASDVASTRRLETTLAALDYSGQRTDSPAGIERALYELRERGREEARKAIVFLTDGQIDTGDARRDVEVARWLREDLAGESADGDVRIFGIAFTEAADYQLMQALALRTSASYYRAFAPGELGPVVEDVLTKIGAAPVYELAYSAPATPPPATAPAPDVAAAPLHETEEGPGLIAWVPALLFLVGAGYVLARRARPPVPAPSAASAPAAQLLDVGGQIGTTGRTFPLGPERTKIGRDPHNDLVLEDDTISSEHAAIEVRDGRYWLEDLRSTNGTRLGDRRLAEGERLPLKGGDHVRFADVDLMFIVEGYVPGGATVYLSSSSTPPADWSVLGEGNERPAAPIEPSIIGEAPPADEPRGEDVRRDAASGETEDAASGRAKDATSGEVVFAEQRVRLDPADVVDLDEHIEGASAAGTDASEPTPSQTAVERAESALEAIEAEPESRPTGRPNLELVTTPPASEDEPAASMEETAPAPVVSAAPEVDEEATEIFADEPTKPEGEPVPLVESASEDDPDATAEVTVPSFEDEPTHPPGAADDSSVQPLAACLDYHLTRVAEISPAFRQFVDRAFPNDLRQALPVTALEVVKAACASGHIELRPYSRDRVRYVVCGVPGAMSDARDRFVADFGGFTRVLTEQLQDESFSRDRCQILALLTCGFDDQPWVSLSIVPDEGRDPRIDLLSYEFLTDEERSEIEPRIDPEISQSGLA